MKTNPRDRAYRSGRPALPLAVVLALAVTLGGAFVALKCRPAVAAAQDAPPPAQKPPQGDRPVEDEPDVPEIEEDELPPGQPVHVPQRESGETAAGGPNVVIFLIDTLRADRVGAYGYTKHPNTPAADALAAEGVVFEQAYAPAPWTLPSVASLFTSAWACAHSTISRHTRLSDEWDTLAERMKRAGYATYCFFSNDFLAAAMGLPQGFDVHRGIKRFDGEKFDRALGKSPKLPMLLYIHNIEPHNPYHFAPPHTPGFPDVSPEIRKRMRRAYEGYKRALCYDFQRKQPLGTTDVTEEIDAYQNELFYLRREYSDLYDASVRFADDKLASVIAKLKERGWWDNTLFILLSDHGEEFGEHGGWLHSQSLYEELLRVPLIVHFPKGRFAGKRVKEPVSLLDVLPTVMEVIGKPELGGGVAGHSLLPLVEGGRSPRGGEPMVVGIRANETNYYSRWKQSRGDINLAVRDGAWKGIWNAQLNKFELYDLSVDPLETQNVASQRREHATALWEFLRTFYEQCREAARAPAPAPRLDPRSERNLKALGYAE